MKQSRFAVIEFDHEKGVECSAFILDPSGRTVLSFDLSPSKARRVALWDIDSGAMVKCDTFADRLNPSALKASPDHSRIAAANARQIALLDASSLRVVSSIKFPRPACTHNLAWSKDGRMLTRGSWDLEAFCWDVPSGKMISQIAFDDAVEFAAFTEGDAEILLGVGSEVLGWNFRSGKTHRRLKFKDADGYSWEHALSHEAGKHQGGEDPIFPEFSPTRAPAPAAKETPPFVPALTRMWPRQSDRMVGLSKEGESGNADKITGGGSPVVFHRFHSFMRRSQAKATTLTRNLSAFPLRSGWGMWTKRESWRRQNWPPSTKLKSRSVGSLLEIEKKCVIAHLFRERPGRGALECAGTELRAVVAC